MKLLEVARKCVRRANPLVFVLVILGAIVGSRPALAVAIYTFQSTCQTDCANIGLGIGDSVSGSIEILDASAVANAALTKADVSGFSFNFGSVHLDDTSAAGLWLSGNLSADISELSVIAFMASEVIDPTLTLATSGDTIIFPIGNVFGSGNDFDWIATHSGACDSADCLGFGTNNLAVGPQITQGAAPLTLVAQTPEPQTLPLIIGGIALIALSGWHPRRGNGG